MKKKLNYLFIVLFCIIISFPLFQDGLINGHDLRFHLSRILAISDGFLKDDFLNYIHYGYFNNYGYAIGLFYSNVFLYIPAFLKFLGMSLVDSYKVFLIICNFCTAFSMYYCMMQVSKKEKLSTIAAILYILIPYRICDLFVRAALGEVLAFIFIPFVFLGVYEFIHNQGKRWWFLAIGAIGLIFSHVISVIIMFLVCFSLLFVYSGKLWNKKAIGNLLKTIIFVLLVTAFYLFPMIEQLVNYEFTVNTATIKFNSEAYVIPFLKIFSGISWQSNIFIPAGISFVIIYILCLRFKIKDFKFNKICDVCLIMGTILTLCATEFFPWDRIKILSIIQFPWRFYIVAFSFFSVAAAIILDEYSKTKTKIYIVVVILLCLVAPIINVYNQFKGDDIIHDYEEYDVGCVDYLPIKVSDFEFLHRGEIATSNNLINIDLKRQNNVVIVKYSNNVWDNTYIELPLLYYDGYYATGDLKVDSGDNGLVTVRLKDESGSVKVYYRGTKIARVSLVVSIITIIFSIFLLFIKMVKYKLIKSN